MPTHSTKRSTTFRLSEGARDLLKRLKEKHGVSEADVVEMALRRMSRVDLAEGRWPALTVLDAASSLIKDGTRQAGETGGGDADDFARATS